MCEKIIVIGNIIVTSIIAIVVTIIIAYSSGWNNGFDACHDIWASKYDQSKVDISMIDTTGNLFLEQSRKTKWAINQ